MLTRVKISTNLNRFEDFQIELLLLVYISHKSYKIRVQEVTCVMPHANSEASIRAQNLNNKDLGQANGAFYIITCESISASIT